MGILSGLLLLPITAPVRGLQFIVEQIQAEAEAALMDERRIHAELINLSLQLDMGEITEAEYEEQEAALLERLNLINAYREGLMDELAVESDYDYDEVEPVDDDR